MRIGVLREVVPGEKRVALVPETVKRLVAKKHEVLVESTAGIASGASDDEYVKAGATIAPDAQAVYAGADVLLKVQAPTDAEIGKLRKDTTLVSFIYPLSSPELLQKLGATKALDDEIETGLGEAVAAYRASFLA